MNVVMVSPYPLNPQYVSGGVESVASTLAPALAGMNGIRHLHVLSPTSVREILRVSVSEKLTIWHYPAQKKFKLVTGSILERWFVSRLAKMIRPDIVHGQGIGIMGELAETVSSNVVVTAHGIGYVEVQKTSSGSLQDVVKILLLRTKTKKVLEKAKAVISTTSYDRSLLGKLVCGKLFSIPNPVLPLFFSPKHGEDPQPYILSAGVLLRRKNIEGLLDAFAEIAVETRAYLHIAGPQPDPLYKAEIEKKIAGLDGEVRDRVKLLGFLTNEELAAQIRQCALLSIFSWEETRPTIVSQAMASGKPVVAADVGGISELIVEGQNGFLIAPGDQHALAAGLKTLLISQPLRKEMGARSFEIAMNEFGASRVAEKTLACYRTLI